jgi:hypothetical protein
MTSLTALDLSSCYDVDDEALLIVAKLPHLKSLSLSWSDISDDALTMICGGQIKRRDERGRAADNRVVHDFTVCARE